MNLQVDVDRPWIESNLPQTRYVRIRLKAPWANRSLVPPAHVVFVVDTSGSMREEKIQTVINAVDAGLNHLRPRDTFSIIEFSKNARRLIGPVPAAIPYLGRAAKALRSLYPRGATDIWAGCKEGQKALDSAPADHERMILLSDGIANRGYVDGRSLAALTAPAREGLILSTIGIGEDVNEMVLEDMALRGFGQYTSIARDWRVAPIMRQELITRSNIAMRGAVLEVTARDRQKGQLRVITRGSIHLSHKRGALSIGNLVSEEVLELFLEVSFEAKPRQSAPSFTVKIWDKSGNSSEAEVGFPIRPSQPPDVINLDVLVGAMRAERQEALFGARRLHHDGQQRKAYGTLHRLANLVSRQYEETQSENIYNFYESIILCDAPAYYLPMGP